MTWFFDPRRSYEDNVRHGPFGAFADEDPSIVPAKPSHRLWDVDLASTFGIPAGPLVNARFCAAAFRHGFDVNVYKTVRSRATAAHPFPNTLAVHVAGDLTLERAAHQVLADDRLDSAESISNSFGVPSQSPQAWQPDMAVAVESAGPGQVLIASFQGTRDGDDDEYVRDHARTARMVADTGATVMELNVSCPNEGTGSLLCHDPALVRRVLEAVRDEIGDIPLLLKIAYLPTDDALATLVDHSVDLVDGYAAINTIPATLVDAAGHQALPGAGRLVGGVCGAAIRWAGLDMVTRLFRLREATGTDYSIVGVGGVMTVADDRALRDAGADAVMSATGAMIDPGLGARIREQGATAQQVAPT